jgi:hypothetical protein
VVDVGDDLLEHLGNVVVVELVDDLAAVPAPGDEPQVAQQPQLMGDRRGLISTASARSPTDAGPAWRRASSRSRLGADSTCIASAAACA